MLLNQLAHRRADEKLEDLEAMGLSTTHLMILVAIIVLLFGRNKISDLMGDVGRGIKSFKKGIADDPVVEANGVPAADVRRESIKAS